MTPYAYRRGPAKAGKKKRDDPEYRFQCDVAKYLTWALPPEILWTATLNGLYRTPKQRTDMADAGLRPGIPDLVFVLPGRGTKMIELKSDTGSLMTEQKCYRDALGPDNWALCRTLENVRDALISWGVTPLCEIGKANRYALSQ